MFMELFNSWCFYPTISNDIESYGVMDEDEENWDIIDKTPFTEPLWGVVVNK
jgi:hypothetical protein